MVKEALSRFHLVRCLPLHPCNCGDQALISLSLFLYRSFLCRRHVCDPFKERLNGVQCTVDSSQELCQVVAEDLPRHLKAHRAPGLTLVIIDSIGAFYSIDRACSHNPTAPNQATHRPVAMAATTETLISGTHFSAPAPFGARRTLPQVHTELAQSVTALRNFPVAVFLTEGGTASEDQSGWLQPRRFLPTVWDVCPPRA